MKCKFCDGKNCDGCAEQPIASKIETLLLSDYVRSLPPEEQAQAIEELLKEEGLAPIEID